MFFDVKSVIHISGRGERLLQTHILIGQEVQLPSSDLTRATELFPLFDHNTSL